MVLTAALSMALEAASGALAAAAAMVAAAAWRQESSMVAHLAGSGN